MDKILFISSLAFYNNTGGAQCSKRNYTMLQKVFKLNCVFPYALIPFNKKTKGFKDILNTINNLFHLRQNGVTAKDEREIIKLINEKKINKVFVDCSINGSLIRIIKNKTSAIVYAFFHNCESDLIFQYIKKGNILQVPRFFSSFINEELTCKCADYIIGLNERDQSIIKEKHGRNFDYIIPISLDGKKENENFEELSPIDILFVGSNFFPNIQGINWFIKNITPHINQKLTIIGKDLEKAAIHKHERVQVIGSVDSISPYYKAAKLVVIPIFCGSGMKVKTAEAMKYGKVIIGTKEAFEGYKKCNGMYECNTKEEFINCLNTINNYTSETENLFNQEYSHETIVQKFHEIFS